MKQNKSKSNYVQNDVTELLIYRDNSKLIS